MEAIDKIVLKLDKELNGEGANFFCLDELGVSEKYEIVCDNYEVYKDNEKLKKWSKILRKLYPNCKWYMVYIKL
jgi:hypothetical protein